MPHTDVIPTSASTASKGFGIRYIGNYCYAYNNVTAELAQQLILDFTTGSGIIVGQITFYQFQNPEDPHDNASTAGELKYNGETVASLGVGTDGFKNPTWVVVNIVIPPRTRVQCYLDGTQSDASDIGSVILNGRVYGAA